LDTKSYSLEENPFHVLQKKHQIIILKERLKKHTFNEAIEEKTFLTQ
jgi:hypothetical protein